jgi:hypothetical protein
MVLQSRKNIQAPPILLQRAKLLSHKAEQINKNKKLPIHIQEMCRFPVGHSDILTMVTTVYKAATFRGGTSKQPDYGH